MDGKVTGKGMLLAVVLAFAIAMAFGVAGCASQSNGMGAANTTGAWTDAAGDDGSADRQGGKGDMLAGGMGVVNGTSERDAGTAGTADAAAPSVTNAAGGLEMPTDTSVKEGSVRLVTSNYDKTFATLSDLVGKHGAKVTYRMDTKGGGWVYTGTSKVEKSKDARQLEMVLRVPNAEVYAFLDGLTMAEGVEVESLFVSSVDVSDEIEGLDTAETDAQVKLDEAKARLDEVRAKRDAGEATDDDVKVVEKKVVELESEFGRIHEVATQLDEDVAMSEVSLTLREQVHPSGNDALSEALDNSWSAFASNAGMVLAIIVWMLPYLLVIAIVFGIVAFTRSRMPKKAANAERVPEAPVAEGSSDGNEGEGGEE